MNQHARIYVAGGDTMLGHALRERLSAQGYTNLVGTPPDEPDLTCPGQVEDFFAEHHPQYVFVAAGESGGIGCNRTRPADLMLDNLLVAAHVIPTAHAYGVRKLLYLASSCSYPRLAPQPLAVESLHTGPLEPTSAAYATAKLAGMQLCQAYRRQHGANFITAIPACAFGPNDHFDASEGHVIPALVRRMHDAKANGDPAVTIWGSGLPRREFIHAHDAADACIFAMNRYGGEAPLNLGTGADFSIAEVAGMIAAATGYLGKLAFDPSKPDGAPLKMLDSTPLREMGWRPRLSFQAALTETYHWFLQHEVMEDPEDVSDAVPLAVPDSAGGGRDRPRLSLR